MTRMLDILFQKGQISEDDRTKLHRAIKMRNRAVHELREPDKLEALRVYEDITDFIQKKGMNAGK